MKIFENISKTLNPRTKCSKCQRPYNDFAINFDEGTIKCMGCESSVDIVKELGRDQAIFILDAMLAKGNLSPEHYSKAEQLKKKIDAT